MPLTPGTRLGPYEILAPIGAGGMGEVYKARDTRLDRTVAVKVSSQQFSERFEREARAVASLNHRHICTLHDVGPDYLVMEYIEGTPLKGPLPLDQVLKYAAQICDALDAAHQKGITHRDLKPANILVTKVGIKLLDFGLAKIGPAATPSSEATLTMALTGKNEIVGTLYYMSPEQLQSQGTGQEIDGRSDIFSFGIVLYEMLTGKRAFEGTSAASVIAAIMERPAPSIAAIAPPALNRALQRCLNKDREDRWQNARDLKAELEWIAGTVDETPAFVAAVPQRRALPWMIAAGLLALILSGALWDRWRVPRQTADRPLIQLDLDAGEAVEAPILSPDGSSVVFVSRGTNGSHLSIRRLDQISIRTLAGTEGARYPFFSPDSRSVAFFTGDSSSPTQRRLKTVSLDGAATKVLADADDPGGGSWGESGLIAAIPQMYRNGIVYRIPALGGSPEAWIPAVPGEDILAPMQLPHGKGLIFTSRTSWPVYSYSLRLALPGQSQSRVLLQNASGARYLDGGYLLFHRQGKIFAAPFDLEKLQVSGEGIPMVDDVVDREGYPFFDVSSTGTLVYRRGRSAGRIVVRIDAAGKQEPIISDPGGYITPRLSPDGKQVAVTDVADPKGRILIHDLAHDTTRRLTLDDRPQGIPVWSPDGQHVFYHSGDATLSVRADGAGQPAIVSTDPTNWLYAFSRDGKFAAGYRANGRDEDVWVAPIDRSGGGFKMGQAVTVAGGPGGQTSPIFSPDGRWITYMSNESGAYRVYVVSLTPDGQPAGGKWQISTGVGYDPKWPAAGGRILFQAEAQSLAEASYTVKGESFVSEPQRAWSTRRLSYFSAGKLDATPDGKVIAIVDADSAAPETHLRLILNFGDEVRRRLAK